MVEAYLQIIGTVLILLGVLPATDKASAVPCILIGAILWFITYYNDDDDDDDFKY